jgi:hypothetical protein
MFAWNPANSNVATTDDEGEKSMLAQAQFLAPALALIAWTLVMWTWMYATRLPAMRRAGIAPQEAAYPGTLAQRVPPSVRSVADNYNHLHEQPTLFYALLFFAALTGGADATALALAWAYVGLRVLHSLIQATINRVVLRFVAFAAGSLVLAAFVAKEALRLLA